MQKLLTKYIRRNQSKREIDALNRWKRTALAQVEARKTEAEKELAEKIGDFEEFRQKAKDQNVARCFKYFQ